MRHVSKALAVCLLLAGELHAQAGSPVLDFLASARAALNDLRYTDADSIARIILGLEGLRRTERIQALELSAGALFPEQESAQKRDLALESLRQLVRIAPSATLPREITWTGLEALHREARASTFGFTATPREQNTLTGPDESVEVDLVTTRPTQTTLFLRTGGGTTQVLDTATISSQGVLRFKVLKNGTPQFTSNSYGLLVTGIDPSTNDTIRLAFTAKLTAPPLEYVPVPQPSDTG